jgi:hypothetical protein
VEDVNNTNLPSFTYVGFHGLLSRKSLSLRAVHPGVETFKGGWRSVGDGRVLN